MFRGYSASRDSVPFAGFSIRFAPLATRQNIKSLTPLGMGSLNTEGDSCSPHPYMGAHHGQINHTEMRQGSPRLRPCAEQLRNIPQLTQGKSIRLFRIISR